MVRVGFGGREGALASALISIREIDAQKTSEKKMQTSIVAESMGVWRL